MTEPELAYLLARYGLIVFTRPMWGHVFLITPTNRRTVGDGSYTAEFRMVGDIPVVAEFCPLPTGRKPLEEVLTRARLAELDALERAAEEAGEADCPPEVEQAAYRACDAAQDALRRAMFGPRPSERPTLYVRIDRARRDVGVLTAADLDDYTPLTPDWFAIDDLPDSVTYDQLLELLRLRDRARSCIDRYSSSRADLERMMARYDPAKPPAADLTDAQRGFNKSVYEATAADWRANEATLGKEAQEASAAYMAAKEALLLAVFGPSSDSC